MQTNNSVLVTQQIKTWLEQVVIGLNLCPFAKRPYKQKQVKIAISTASDDDTLLQDLLQQFKLLENTPIETTETSVLVVTNHLQDFFDYNDFLNLADALIEQYNWQGVFQIASFHPHYQFAGTTEQDPENLTNKAPYPILHILRESSLDKAVESHPDVDGIPEQNIAKMNQLTKEQITELFGYLKD
ncbi:DUF1415 domain-containing protein [Catenovulum adriaticum]|uniref:DUF1415 domain-containing protein n=1 Tax=Catenovulum adriaticum TaxID=2984846 RepID=A0ABY7APQ2_9ALTE|nr:DUF1415 domain-containing protein [Catenovulum sp. TS8]WAJ70279.1 DUF1415 domain-containing protein [Catenovulum sp. TS8]